jgi:hypothetical protein
LLRLLTAGGEAQNAKSSGQESHRILRFMNSGS